LDIRFSFDVGRSMFDVRRSSFNITCECLQNNLALMGIAPAPFLTARAGLQAIVDDKIDAFVFDELVLY